MMCPLYPPITNVGPLTGLVDATVEEYEQIVDPIIISNESQPVNIEDDEEEEQPSESKEDEEYDEYDDDE